MRRFLCILSGCLVVGMLSCVVFSSRKISHGELPDGFREQGSIAINEQNFPSEDFRTYINEEYDEDKDGVLSQKEIEEADFLTLSAPTRLFADQTEEYVLDLTGIQYLEALSIVRLSVYDRVEGMEQLFHLKNLKTLSLICTEYDFPTDVKSDSLKNLEIHICKESTVQQVLSALKGFPNLKKLDITSETDMATLNLCDNPQLQTVICRVQGLKQLDVSKNTKLKKLDCSEGVITELDLSSNQQLKTLYCYEDYLESIDVSNLHYLTKIHLQGKKIKQIILNEEVEDLSIAMTQLEILSLENCQKIKTLDCCDNSKLKQINHLEDAKQLKTFQAGYVFTKKTKLTTLDLQYNTKLKTLVLNYPDGELERISLPENYFRTCDEDLTCPDESGGSDLYSIYLGQSCPVKILDLSAVKKLNQKRRRLIKYWIQDSSVNQVVISNSMSPKLTEYVKQQCKKYSCQLQYVS